VPELRFDPLSRRQVILAPDRAQRGAPAFQVYEPDPHPCDFCGGREDRTPPETFSIRHDGSAPDTPGWSVRVVPNLYPATPFHEVVVHTPEHYAQFEDRDPKHRVEVLQAYRTRLLAAPTPAVVPVWNRGRPAGASRTHPHGQLFGLDRAPPVLEREAASFADDPCVLCAMADETELSITASKGHRLIAHPVPVVADELLLVPPCTPRFEEVGDEELGEVARLISAAIERSLRVHGRGLPFNLVFHTAPRAAESFHWHAHFMPRTAVWGGLEMGAELPIVAADPYETARRLRES
jgi:UDPglucose--hexose-1-phosphate uridylyltransferase